MVKMFIFEWYINDINVNDQYAAYLVTADRLKLKVPDIFWSGSNFPESSDRLILSATTFPAFRPFSAKATPLDCRQNSLEVWGKMNYGKSVISGKKLAEVLVHWVREFHQMPSTKYKTRALFFGIRHIRLYSMLSWGGSGETLCPKHHHLWAFLHSGQRLWCVLNAAS